MNIITGKAVKNFFKRNPSAKRLVVDEYEAKRGLIRAEFKITIDTTSDTDWPVDEFMEVYGE